MKSKKLALFLVLVLAVSSLLMACGKKDDDKTDKSSSSDLAAKQEINLFDVSEIPSMDPTIATDQVSFEVMGNTMEGLYSLGKDDAIEPGVAKGDPVISEDGKTWKFELREDAVYNDGTQVKAQDFVYMWRRAVDPATKAEYAYMLYPVKNAEEINTGKMKPDQLGIVADDDTHLTVTLENPAPYFQSLMAFATFFPQPEEFVKAQGDKYGTEYNTQLYNGPFVLSSWEHEVGWTYEKNEKYWDKDAVKLTKINVKVLKDEATPVNLYEKGELDRVGLTAQFIDQFKDRDDFGTSAETSVYFLRFNQKNPIIKNVDARKALAMAFDKQALTDVVLKNGSFPANFIIPKDFTLLDGKDFREANGDMNVYDVAKAQEHWEAAKKALGKDSITLTLLNYDSENSKKVGEFLQEQMQKNLPGLKINIKAQPFAQKLDLETKGDYDFSFAGWGPDYKDPMTFLDMFMTGNGNNQMSFSNADYDKLVKDAATTLAGDAQGRWEAMQKAEKILVEQEQAIGPLYQLGRSFLQNPKVVDIYLHKFGADYTYKYTYVKK